MRQEKSVLSWVLKECVSWRCRCCVDSWRKGGIGKWEQDRVDREAEKERERYGGVEESMEDVKRCIEYLYRRDLKGKAAGESTSQPHRTGCGSSIEGSGRGQSPSRPRRINTSRQQPLRPNGIGEAVKRRREDHHCSDGEARREDADRIVNALQILH